MITQTKTNAVTEMAIVLPLCALMAAPIFAKKFFIIPSYCGKLCLLYRVFAKKSIYYEMLS